MRKKESDVWNSLKQKMKKSEEKETDWTLAKDDP